jgi:hypothetical protein
VVYVWRAENPRIEQQGKMETLKAVNAQQVSSDLSREFHARGQETPNPNLSQSGKPCRNGCLIRRIVKNTPRSISNAKQNPGH